MSHNRPITIGDRLAAGYREPMMATERQKAALKRYGLRPSDFPDFQSASEAIELMKEMECRKEEK